MSPSAPVPPEPRAPASHNAVRHGLYARAPVHELEAEQQSGRGQRRPSPGSMSSASPGPEK